MFVSCKLVSLQLGLGRVERGHHQVAHVAGGFVEVEGHLLLRRELAMALT